MPVFGSVRISVEISLFISADTSCVLGPNVDDLVVFFRTGDDTVAVLAFDVVHFGGSASMMRFLESGISMSFTPILMPERVAYSYRWP